MKDDGNRLGTVFTLRVQTRVAGYRGWGFDDGCCRETMIRIYRSVICNSNTTLAREEMNARGERCMEEEGIFENGS